MSIELYIRSMDGIEEEHSFESLEDAYDTINEYLGNMWDHGNSYAVNAYGDVTVTMHGATWDEYKQYKLGRMVE